MLQAKNQFQIAVVESSGGRPASVSNQGPAGMDLALRHIIQALPSGVILLDAKGYIAEANILAAAMLGNDLVGQRWLDVIARCFKPRTDDGLEVSLADGRRISIAISTLAPYSATAGLYEQMQLITLTDLTETRALQARVSHMQRLSTLGKMMATLAHQIRTPLTSAMLYAENLTSMNMTAEARSQFQYKLVARLHDLEQQVNDMLLFARSGTAQAVALTSLQQLSITLRQRSEALLLKYNAQLHVALTSPSSQVLINQNSVVEALLNLVQNSLQARPLGARLTLQQQPSDDGRIVLWFYDNGPGIADEILPHIFEPFFSRTTGGSGLGLAVVQAVMQSHHGHVRYLEPMQRALYCAQHAISPVPKDGACFELVFPAQINNIKASPDGCEQAVCYG